MLYKKDVLKIFAKFAEKQLHQSLFFIKLQTSHPLKNRCFPVNFATSRNHTTPHQNVTQQTVTCMTSSLFIFYLSLTKHMSTFQNKCKNNVHNLRKRMDKHYSRKIVLRIKLFPWLLFLKKLLLKRGFLVNPNVIFPTETATQFLKYFSDKIFDKVFLCYNESITFLKIKTRKCTI